MALYYNVLDFHTIRSEAIQKAVEHSACSLLLSNTSITVLSIPKILSHCVVHQSDIGQMVNASIVLCVLNLPSTTRNCLVERQSYLDVATMTTLTLLINVKKCLSSNQITPNV